MNTATTKQCQVLLHIGLPKTATSSLQQNVLDVLHDSGEINFLGRSTYKNRAKYSQFASIYKKIEVPYKLNIDEINILRKQVTDLLVIDKINVLSNENITRINNNTLMINLHNLSQVFQPHQTRLVVSLRSPVDLFFSWYVEFYKWNYCVVTKHNTFEKFAACLLADKNITENTVFFYTHYLKLIDEYFDNKTVLLFEDLQNNHDHYFNIWEDLLNYDAQRIKTLFLVLQRNIAITTKTSKSSASRIQAGKIVRIYLNKLPILKPLYKYIPIFLKYRFWCLLTSLSKIWYKFYTSTAVNHTYPTGELHTKLSATLGIKNITEFAKQHNLDADKLLKYGYGVITNDR